MHTSLIRSLALGCAGAFAASAAPAAQIPSLADAVSKLQAGDTAGAQTALEQITTADPNNAAAWRALAASKSAQHHYGAAIADYRRALKIQADSPKVFYQIGAAYAAKHDSEHAFEWLARARETHRYDMTEITEDLHLAGLRQDPRFKSLLPTPADFEQPFVEPVKIIREWRGEAAGDQFGWIARNIGDVDADGTTDIVTSAPTHGGHAGRIYVYSVGTGRLLWTADGGPGDELGSGVEGIGDANGDGIPDVAASGPSASGVAYIYSGRDGRILQSFKSSRSDELFGNHISGIGDINGDGHADLIVGAPDKADGSANPGHAYIYSGKDGRLLFTLSGERPGDAFGSAVTGYSSGKEHYLIVGAPLAGPDHHGRVYVYDNPAMPPKFVVDADATGVALGILTVDAVTSADESEGPPLALLFVHAAAPSARSRPSACRSMASCIAGVEDEGVAEHLPEGGAAVHHGAHGQQRVKPVAELPRETLQHQVGREPLFPIRMIGGEAHGAEGNDTRVQPRIAHIFHPLGQPAALLTLDLDGVHIRTVR